MHRRDKVKESRTDRGRKVKGRRERERTVKSCLVVDVAGGGHG